MTFICDGCGKERHTPAGYLKVEGEILLHYCFFCKKEGERQWARGYAEFALEEREGLPDGTKTH